MAKHVDDVFHEILFKDREPSKLRTYAEVGGYAILYERNGEVFCAGCAQKEVDNGEPKKSFHPFIHWEGRPIDCDGCQEPQESEYGPIEDND
jgi:hypothetical protein